MVHHSPTRRRLLTLAKIALAVGILGFLIVRIQQNEGFWRLYNDPKDWAALLVAQGLVLVAYSLNFVRWFLLVRGLRIAFHLRDAFRLGSLGFMLNQVSPGSIGGDLFKAVFIAKEQPGQRTEAVATVLIDRIVGLYAMLLVASLGLAFAGEPLDSSQMLLTMKTIVWTAAAGGTFALAWLMTPLATGTAIRSLADRLPLVGHTAARLIDALELYRMHKWFLISAIGLALVTHGLLITAFWSISRGLPVTGPTFTQHAVIVPLGLVVGALPATPGGLGEAELMLEYLYFECGAAKGDGTIVALAYRAMTYVVAALGACYYLSARRSVDRLLVEAEELAEEL